MPRAATSTAAAEKSPSGPPELPHGAAERFIREVIAAAPTSTRETLAAKFLALEPETRVQVLAAWKLQAPAARRMTLIYADFTALQETGVLPQRPASEWDRAASAEPPRSQSLEIAARRPAPPSEVGLAVGEYFAGLGALLAWQIGAAQLIDPKGWDGAALGLLDGTVSSFITAGVIYGLASTSNYYEPSFLHALLAAAGTYAVGIGIAAAGAEKIQDKDSIQPIVLVTIALIPLAATAAINGGKDVIDSSRWPGARMTLREPSDSPRPDDRRPVTFTLFATAF